MKLWFLHLSSRLAKTLFTILLLLLCLYIFLDLSVHGVRFLSSKADMLDLLLYYLFSFSRHFDTFASLAFLLTALKIFFDLMQHSELIALQMAGLSKRKLSLPLFLLAGVLCSLSLANSEWISPNALESIDQFRQTHAKKRRSKQKDHIHSLHLEDGSTLVFQQFDPTTNALHDLFWIRDENKLWHIKRLKLKTKKHPYAQYIDCFHRNSEGVYQKNATYHHLEISDLMLDPTMLLKKYAPFENRPISRLFSERKTSGLDKEPISAHFHMKIATALIPFLIALGSLPSLFCFSRTKSIFSIACGSLFALISFITVLDGMLILAENRVLPPAFSIWILWLVAFIFSLKQWSEPKRLDRNFSTMI